MSRALSGGPSFVGLDSGGGGVGVPRVLVVDDDASVREAVALALEPAGFDVSSIEDGAEAAQVLDAEDFDLVLLDLMLPSMDGYDVCRSVRAHSSVPIIMLTARTESPAVVRGLEAGADDYVTKPFDPAELIARARVAVRRGSGVQRQRWSVRDLTIDEQAGQVLRADEPISLSVTEFRLLIALASRPRHVHSREVLLELVWGYD